MMNKWLKSFLVQKNSLKSRLMISALFMIFIVLPIIGITLNNAFEIQIRNAIKNELSAYSYSILAAAEVEQQQLYMPEQALDNQLNVSQTGLYALITTSSINNEILWRSKSLLGLSDPENLPVPALGKSVYEEIELAGKTHLIYSFSVSFSDGKKAFPMTLHIIKDQTKFLAVIANFNQQLWTWLLVLMVLLIIVQSLWLIWTLKPLTVLKQDLAQVEQGKSPQLKQSYPQELLPVVEQVNLLLTTEQNQRQRYRNALADLAHSLKTPLAVIQSQQDLSPSSQEQVNIINQMIEHQLKRAQSAGQASWHLGIKIKPIANKIINTLNKIYVDKQLTISCVLDEQASFKGDEADLMEMLGNLLDNAYKAAKQQVELNINCSSTEVTIVIADDGQGIDEQQRALILQRGMRADTYQQGHGIGLAIVRDLVNTYQGQLQIKKSSQLLGAMFVLTFPV